MLLLTSCEVIREGTIMEKYYEPERTYTVLEQDLIVGGFKMVKKTDDEDYVFIINGKTKSGDTQRKRIEVSKLKYHKYEVGDFIKL